MGAVSGGGGGSGDGGEGEGSGSSLQGAGASAGSVSPRPSPGTVDGGDDDGRLSAIGPEGGGERGAGVNVGGGGGGGGGGGDGDGTPNASPSLAGVDGAEEAAGGYWGLSGWFSRRSGMSPPPTLEEGQKAAVAVGGVVIDQRRVGASAEADKAGIVQGRLARVTTAAAAGAKGGGRLTAPSPLSIEVVGAGRRGGEGGGEGGHVSSDSDDDDEDLYGKTLRPTSEQLVRFCFSGAGFGICGGWDGERGLMRYTARF